MSKRPTGGGGGSKKGGSGSKTGAKGVPSRSARGASGRGTGQRNMHTKVKTARGRKISSTLWLQRQLNDPYVQRAKAEGWRSRAAYKMIEINDRYDLLKSGQRVLDLGAAPGGWCQVAAQIVGSTNEDVRVVGIDFLPIDPIEAVTLLEMDFLDDEAPDALLAALGGNAPDIVLSDMAAPTTGHRRTDQIRTMHLCEEAAAFAVEVLAPGGHFLCKTFQGGTEKALLDNLKKHFTSVHHVKPPASRDGSPELYLLAKKLRAPKA
ncbi:MAG: RlmE family RNA methyltransferase [Pseudomonadota bacterium]